MSKQEFLMKLRKGLSGLSKNDIDEHLAFYSEMIDDRIEEGLSEEDAVCEMGDVDELISQIVAEIPLAKLVKERITPKQKLNAWEIILLVLGSPIWLSLLIAAFAVIISIYVSLWAVFIALWAVFGALVGCTFAGLVAGIVFACLGNVIPGIAMLSAVVVCTGFSIFMIYGCKAATKGIAVFTKKFVTWLKNCFMKKEVA